MRLIFISAAFALIFGAANIAAQQPSQPSTTSPGAPAETTTPSTPTQTTAPSTPAPATTTGSADKKDQPAPASPLQKQDRIFFALPNPLTVENAKTLPPLTVKQKFKAVATGVFDPVEFVFVGAQAGIGQADNTNPTYGQGALGFGRRFGTAYLDATISNFSTSAVYPSLLHQDPRYYQMGSGNPFHRMFYAATRTLVTRGDGTGHEQLNFSEMLGVTTAGLISNAYHPKPHTIVSTSDVLLTQIAVDALSYELKEFWPDLRRAIVRKHQH